MLLQIKCKECGRILGSYDGDEFFIVWEEGKENYSLLDPIIGILCSQCWNERKGKNYETEFQAIRMAILKRDNFHCRKCDSEAQMVHHIDGDRSNNKPQNLISLCPKCHDLIPKHPYQTVRSIRTMRKTTTTEGFREYMRLYMREYRAKIQLRKLLESH
jgi:DNA-directed RNA polymerase subunit M/transcription elongation factor TFIIS